MTANKQTGIIAEQLQSKGLMTNAPPLVSTAGHSSYRGQAMQKAVWTAKVITLFPDTFPGVLGCSLAGKALASGIWKLETVDLRQFGIGRHRQVDDTPAGGGAGMILKPEVVAAALEFAQSGVACDRAQWPILYLSPRGQPFRQEMAMQWSKVLGITFICGRYEGMDERVIETYEIEEVSLGDFVLSGGEIATQALIDAMVRVIPRTVGNQESTVEESFSNGLLEYPQYTRPRIWKDQSIPEPLHSGNHDQVTKWRRKQAERITKTRRPDLWRRYCEHNTNTS